jgi:hypothetical protein
MTRKLDQTTKKGKQMTEELQEVSTGAPFHGVADWHAINWQSANQNVRPTGCATRWCAALAAEKECIERYQGCWKALCTPNVSLPSG